MTRRRAAGLLLAVACIGGGRAAAQPPSIEELQAQIKRLTEEMANQRRMFETQIAELQGRIDTGLRDELQTEIGMIGEF